MSKPKNNNCILCGAKDIGFGNNPEPLKKYEEGQCCDTCNDTKVIPARLKGFEGEVSVGIKTIPKNKLYLKEQIGNGTYGKSKFTICHTIPDRSILVSIDNKDYIVSQQSIVESIIHYHEKNN